MTFRCLRSRETPLPVSPPPNVEISRSGDRLLYIRNIGVDISLPSVLSGSPRVSLIGLDGVDTSLKALRI